jgi:hypothetical protein
MNLNLQAGMVLGVVQLAVIILILFVSIPITFYLARIFQKSHNQGINQKKYKSIFTMLRFGLFYFFVVLILIYLLFQIDSGPT